MLTKTIALILMAIAPLDSAVLPMDSASCRHSGTTQKSATSSLAVGSQVDGDLVTICANRKLLQKLQVAVKPAPIKVPAKAPVKTPSKPPGKPAAPPKPVPKPSHKPSVRTSTRATNSGSTAVFKPVKPLASVWPGQSLKPGESARFKVAFGTQLGSSVLYGKKVVVRFVPTAASWDFGETPAKNPAATNPTAATQNTTTGQTASHAYQSSGSYMVVAHVTYRVSYRLQNGGWLADPDPIVLAATPLNLKVGQALASQSSGTTVLVNP